MPEDKRKCFIVTPIGSADDPIRRHIDGIIDQAIYPALDEKYDIDVAHRRYEIGSINDRIVKSIYNADLVIANLTGLNPNVMYELAIRHSFGKPAIVIAEKGTKLPFDVIDENTIFYINDPAGANDLKNNITEFENNIDYTKQDYGPVYKAIKNIALYREVESGHNISDDKKMEYIISRLDNIENNILNASRFASHSEYYNGLDFTFKSGEWNGDDVKEIICESGLSIKDIMRVTGKADGFTVYFKSPKNASTIDSMIEDISDILMDKGHNHFSIRKLKY